MSRTIQLTDCVARTSGHLAEEIDGQLVLLSIEAGNYYGMDEIGSEIWRLLEKETLVSDLCVELSFRYEAPAGVIENDVFTFLNRLFKQGLITAR